MDCILPGSSVHRILQARILQWVAISFSWGSSQCRDWTNISCITGGFFTTEPPGNPSTYSLPWIFWKEHPPVSHTNVLSGASLLWLPPSTHLTLPAGDDEGSLVSCTNVRSGVLATNRFLFTQQIQIGSWIPQEIVQKLFFPGGVWRRCLNVHLSRSTRGPRKLEYLPIYSHVRAAPEVANSPAISAHQPAGAGWHRQSPRGSWRRKSLGPSAFGRSAQGMMGTRHRQRPPQGTKPTIFCSCDIYMVGCLDKA